MIRRPRRFGAALDPSGLFLVEYRKTRNGVEVVRSLRDLTVLADPREAAKRLAELVRGAGAEEARLALAVSGWETCHHILALPPASDEHLRPIVERELRRFYPELQDPQVAFTRGGWLEERGVRKQEVLVGGFPRAAAEAVHHELARSGIVLEQLTILPEVVQRLYDLYVTGEETTALALLLPTGPVLGFFHGGALRLFSAPPPRARRGGGAADPLLEQLERGILFLRQQFRGALLERIMVSAEAADADRLAEVLQQHLPLATRQLGPVGLNPGALLALGAALSADEGRSVNLLPHALRPAPLAQRLGRVLWSAAAAVLLIAASAWAWDGLRRVELAAAERNALAREVELRIGPLAAIRPALSERQSHERRIRFLEGLATERRQLQEVLWAVGQETPGAIRLDALALERRGEAWHARLQGTARSESSAGAVRAVDRLVRGLERRLASTQVRVERLDYPDADAPAAFDGVVMSFAVGVSAPAASPVMVR
jgi:Tfp pilus assembly PilM family ATPase